jgi:alkylation response protein AidB-like acyl-CoA dehydrogenase
MDFAFSEEQEMLRTQARAFLTDNFPAERVASLADSRTGWDPASWRAMGELGWIGLSAPESAGGAGMSFLDEAVLFEELGRALWPGPYFSTVALSMPALERSAEAAGRAVAGEGAATLAWAEPGGPCFFADLASTGCRAEESNGSWRLTGEKILIPDAGSVTDTVVVARSASDLGMWLVSGAAAEVESTVDSTRRLGRLHLEDAEATLLVRPGEALALISAIRLRALAALALEAVGVAERVLDVAVEHAKTRRQFGKPIGTYQAVSHQIADTYADVELARSLAYWAAWCVAEEDGPAHVAVPAAKSFAADASVAACERAIQVLGGMGFTWEHPLHRYYKRAQWIAAFDGPPAAQRSVVAAALLDGDR